MPETPVFSCPCNNLHTTISTSAEVAEQMQWNTKDEMKTDNRVFFVDKDAVAAVEAKIQELEGENNGSGNE